MKREMPLQLLVLRLRFHCLRLGWPALFGAGLVAGALAIDLSASEEVDGRIAELRQTRQVLRDRQASEASRDEKRNLPLADVVERQAIDLVVADIHAAAQKNGVRLEQGEYRLQAESATPLGKYQIVFPARATYPQLRAWLDETVAAHPGLAVQEFSAKRENIKVEALEARVSLGLLVQAK